MISNEENMLNIVLLLANIIFLVCWSDLGKKDETTSPFVFTLLFCTWSFLLYLFIFHPTSWPHPSNKMEFCSNLVKRHMEADSHKMPFCSGQLLQKTETKCARAREHNRILFRDKVPFFLLGTSFFPTLTPP